MMEQNLEEVQCLIEAWKMKLLEKHKTNNNHIMVLRWPLNALAKDNNPSLGAFLIFSV